MRNLMKAIVVALMMLYAMGALAQTPRQQNSLKQFMREYLKAEAEDLEDDDTTFSSAFVDLNEDGKKEVIVYLSGRDWCGTGGCVMLVLAPKESTYRVVSEVTITRPPIRVLNTKTKGWRDIAVLLAGGGIRHPYEARLQFDGRSYPKNPTAAPAQRLREKVAGSIVIASESKGTALY
jgi:hypothetical protein